MRRIGTSDRVLGLLADDMAAGVGEEIFYSSLAEGSITDFDELSRRLAAYDGPRGYDPRATLAALSTPGFWILGGQDRSVPTRETVAILRELAGMGRPYRWTFYEQAGHGLVDVRGGAGKRLADILAFMATDRALAVLKLGDRPLAGD